MPKTRISSGVISEPPPIPVVPTSTPTPRPKSTIAGSITRGRAGAARTRCGRCPAQRPSRPAPGDRAVRAADRAEAPVVQRVVGDVVRGDVAPHVALGPVGQRRGLPLACAASQPSFGVPPARGVWSRRSPVIQASTVSSASSSGLTLRMPQQASGSRAHSPSTHVAAVDVDRDPVALLDAAPRGVGLLEQHAGVEHEEARGGLDPHEHVEDHRRLLLERAGDVQARVELAHHVLEHPLRIQGLEVRGCGGSGQEALSIETPPAGAPIPW